MGFDGGKSERAEDVDGGKTVGKCLKISEYIQEYKYVFTEDSHENILFSTILRLSNVSHEG